MKLILASASPRRAELLQQIAVTFEVRAVDIDETPMKGESPENYVTRLALEKARVAWRAYPQEEVLVLGSDTAVIVDNEILGKPADRQHALTMLRQLSGKTHHVLTSVAIIGQQEECVVNDNKVTFAKISEEELEWYLSTGESEGKAGGYAIQGKAAVFVSRLEGSFSGVMGLPLYETSQLLKQHGLVIG
ncbi:MAG: Maf family protein [Cycloclasticus sp.]